MSGTLAAKEADIAVEDATVILIDLDAAREEEMSARPA